MVYLKNVTTLKLDPDKCTGCGMCESVCPHAVFEISAGAAGILDPDACMECGACAKNCPEGALAVRAGVGCAAGVINGYLNRSGPDCGCSVKTGKSTCC
jgi:NAD-dependent dihydropyrimidine dehydrogenase PreA subunit